MLGGALFKSRTRGSKWNLFQSRGLFLIRTERLEFTENEQSASKRARTTSRQSVIAQGLKANRMEPFRNLAKIQGVDVLDRVLPTNQDGLIILHRERDSGIRFHLDRFQDGPGSRVQQQQVGQF